MTRFRVIQCIAFLLAGCSEHPGFKEVQEDVFLKYHALGEGEVPAREGDSILVRMRMALVGEAVGSLLSTQRWYAAEDMLSGALLPILQRVHEGDSVSVIARSMSIPWELVAPRGFMPPAGVTHVQVEFAMYSIRTPEMIAEEQELHRQADPEGFERKLILAFIERSGHSWEQWGTSSLFHRISGEALDTTRVQAGDLVRVSWRGSRLDDGALIDDSHHNGGPFAFRFGDQDQVIKGIETAVVLLREGQEGEFIMPSEMAFGARGVPGVVEPWSPVRYVVKLEGVKRR
jgi:FKBP-type peptidyl-prolyl cis-trans isomerase